MSRYHPGTGYHPIGSLFFYIMREGRGDHFVKNGFGVCVLPSRFFVKCRLSHFERKKCLLWWWISCETYERCEHGESVPQYCLSGGVFILKIESDTFFQIQLPVKKDPLVTCSVVTHVATHVY